MKQEKVQKLLKERLQEKGLKVTKQRQLVFDSLMKNKGRHMTAEEIFGQISKEYPQIGLATIYRTLQLFLELRLVDRINLDDGCVRYEIGHVFKDGAKHNHHHLICTGCGKIQAVEDEFLDNLEQHIEAETGFKIENHEVKFYGRCKECRDT